MKNLANILMVTGFCIMISGCTVTTRPTVGTMEILNERLSNIEEELRTLPPQVAKEEETKRRGIYRRSKLTDAQKEFIEFMMEYLEKK